MLVPILNIINKVSGFAGCTAAYLLISGKSHEFLDTTEALVDREKTTTHSTMVRVLFLLAVSNCHQASSWMTITVYWGHIIESYGSSGTNSYGIVIIPNIVHQSGNIN